MSPWSFSLCCIAASTLSSINSVSINGKAHPINPILPPIASSPNRHIIAVEEFSIESSTSTRTVLFTGDIHTVGTVSLSNTYHRSSDAIKYEKTSTSDKHWTLAPRSKFASVIRNTFLPIGFPRSVPPEYAAYQTWNILQDFCSYLRGIMGTQAILEGLGVGRSDATTLSATLAWIIRDGVSMLGSLLFTSFSSSTFGQNVKSWRYFADTINNVGITLDMLAPLSKQYFVWIISLASICKALCGVAAGAAGVSISEHWGIDGNISDVAAKNNAQHTMVNILGLIFSMQFAKLANKSPRMMWILYTMLTTIHMYSNWRAMKVLAFRTLNIARSNLLIKTFLKTIESLQNNQTVSANMNTNIDEELRIVLAKELSLSSVAKKEPIIIFPNIFYKHSVLMWADPVTACGKLTLAELISTLTLFSDRQYVIFFDSSSGQYSVVVKQGASPMDQLQGRFEAEFYYQFSLEPGSVQIGKIKELFDAFIRLLKDQGWNVDRILLREIGSKFYRFDFVA